MTVRRLKTFAVNGYAACEVHFDKLKVPAENLLGTEGQGFRQLLAMLNAERLSASGNALGMAQGALAVASAYARERKAFDKTLSQMQAVQHKLANAAVAYELAWTYLVAAADVAMITCEAHLGLYAAVDCGAYVANFLSAATSLGLGCIAQAALASHPDAVRSQFQLPASQRVVSRISFGFADDEHPANSFRTSRAGLDDVVTWLA